MKHGSMTTAKTLERSIHFLVNLRITLAKKPSVDISVDSYAWQDVSPAAFASRLC